MGKAKRRSIARGKYDRFSDISREEAIEEVVKRMLTREDVSNLITLFGLKAEELLEAGAAYEDVKSLKGIL